MKKMLKIAAALILLSTSLAQAGTSGWRNDNPGPYTDADTQLTSWNLSGVPWWDIKYTGPINHCPGRPNLTACPATHSKAVSYNWAFLVGAKTGVEAGIIFAKATAEISTSLTVGQTFTNTDSFTFSVPPGQMYQFVSFIPRTWGAANFKGVMAYSGKTRVDRTRYDACLKRGEHPGRCQESFFPITQYYYEWKPDQKAGFINGSKNTKREPVWTWSKVT